jgi:hypothetical protein
MQSYLSSVEDFETCESKNEMGIKGSKLRKLLQVLLQIGDMLMILRTPSSVDRLVEETNDLSCNVLASCLLVVHDTGRCCENNVSELTRWKELDDPLLEVTETDVVAGRDDTGLVETIEQLEIEAELRVL